MVRVKICGCRSVAQALAAAEAGADVVGVVRAPTQPPGAEPWGACLLANRQVIKVVHLGAGDGVESALRRLETGSAAAVLLDRAGGPSTGSGQAPSTGLRARHGGSGQTIDRDAGAGGGAG